MVGCRLLCSEIAVSFDIVQHHSAVSPHRVCVAIVDRWCGGHPVGGGRRHCPAIGVVVLTDVTHLLLNTLAVTMSSRSVWLVESPTCRTHTSLDPRLRGMFPAVFCIQLSHQPRGVHTEMLLLHCGGYTVAVVCAS